MLNSNQLFSESKSPNKRLLERKDGKLISYHASFYLKKGIDIVKSKSINNIGSVVGLMGRNPIEHIDNFPNFDNFFIIERDNKVVRNCIKICKYYGVDLKVTSYYCDLWDGIKRVKTAISVLHLDFCISVRCIITKDKIISNLIKVIKNSCLTDPWYLQITTSNRSDTGKKGSKGKINSIFYERTIPKILKLYYNEVLSFPLSLRRVSKKESLCPYGINKVFSVNYIDSTSMRNGLYILKGRKMVKRYSNE